MSSTEGTRSREHFDRSAADGKANTGGSAATKDSRSDRSGATEEARQETLAVEGSRPFQWLVRTGFLARALTYAAIGAIALALALGAGSEPAAPDQQGALALISRAPLGLVALGVIAAGLLAYALWKLSQGVLGRGPEGGGGPKFKDRISNIAGGVSYAVFFVVAIRVLFAGSGSGSGQAKQTTAGVLGWPGGRWIVGLGGGVLIAISLYQIYEAVRGRFANDSKLEDMSSGERRAFMLLGHLGLVARAMVFVIVGYFLLRTSIDFNPSNAVGVDGALAKVHQEPYGPWLLGLVAAGLITFAAFSVLEARHRRL